MIAPANGAVTATGWTSNVSSGGRDVDDWGAGQAHRRARDLLEVVDDNQGQMPVGSRFLYGTPVIIELGLEPDATEAMTVHISHF